MDLAMRVLAYLALSAQLVGAQDNNAPLVGESCSASVSNIPLLCNRFYRVGSEQYPDSCDRSLDLNVGDIFSITISTTNECMNKAPPPAHTSPGARPIVGPA